MATDFAVSLRRFLTDHLAGLRGCSPNTIVSYRDAFKLLICYFRDARNIPPERLTLELIDVAAVTGFLAWLRTSRHNSASTCNSRPIAGSDFFAPSYCIADVREMTSRPPICARSVVSASVIPFTK